MQFLSFSNLYLKVVFSFKGQRPLVYELYAVVDHIGSLRNGHYTAKIKDENGWYKFDDTSVTPVRIINLV